jgi:hypothetical protein
MLNGTHQLLAYACDVNMVGEYIGIIQKNTKALLGASKEIYLEVNPEKTKYMLLSPCQKAGQRRSIKTANRSFEDVTKFKYLGTTPTDQNCIHEDEEQTELGECLLPFDSECFVIPPAVRKCKG